MLKTSAYLTKEVREQKACTYYKRISNSLKQVFRKIRSVGIICNSDFENLPDTIKILVSSKRKGTTRGAWGWGLSSSKYFHRPL